jgi:deoxycytidylate deaminase
MAQSNDPIRQVSAALVVRNTIYVGVNEIPDVHELNPIWKNRDAVRILATHAEVNAVRSALKDGIENFDDAILYVTLRPCESCMKLIQALGIKMVYYSQEYIPSDIGVKRDTSKHVIVSKLPE